MKLNIGGFPSSDDYIRCQWAPIIIEPILGSGERLTIGVAVTNETGFFVKSANAFSRLECLYGNMAGTVIFAAKASLEALETDLAERGVDALTSPETAFASVFVGEIRDGEGNSLEAVANYWLSASSSLVVLNETGEISEMQVRHEKELAEMIERRSKDKRSYIPVELLVKCMVRYIEIYKDSIKGIVK